MAKPNTTPATITPATQTPAAARPALAPSPEPTISATPASSPSKDDAAPMTAAPIEEPVVEGTQPAEPTRATGKKTVLTLSFSEELAEDIRFVSYVKGISLSDYVTSKVAPTIDADVQAVLAARSRKRG